MNLAFICDAVRPPIGRYGGALKDLRADDLGALPIHALLQRHPQLPWNQVDDVYYGCANQAGEDNRNVARVSALLAGLPASVPGLTLNRLCGSGMDAIGTAARAIMAGEAQLLIAGGVESMTRAPFVMGKAESPYSRNAALQDTTMGWRFINPALKAAYGVETMPETAENVAEDYHISRADQDAFALAGLKGVVRADGSVTAGNASGINDGACALLLASGAAAHAHGLKPLARIVGMATAGVTTRVMGNDNDGAQRPTPIEYAQNTRRVSAVCAPCCPHLAARARTSRAQKAAMVPSRPAPEFNSISYAKPEN